MQVCGPPSAGAFKSKVSTPTNFRKFYERGDFPIALEHDTKGNKIAWRVRWFDSINLQHDTKGNKIAWRVRWFESINFGASGSLNVQAPYKYVYLLTYLQHDTNGNKSLEVKMI